MLVIVVVANEIDVKSSSIGWAPFHNATLDRSNIPWLIPRSFTSMGPKGRRYCEGEVIPMVRLQKR